MAKKIVERYRIIEYILIATFVVFLLLLFRNSTTPYVGVNSWNFNTYAQIARNYTRFGYTPLRLAPVQSYMQNINSDKEYYLHHPPLLYITMSLSFVVFTETFLTGRLPVLLSALGSVVLVYFIGKKLLNKQFAAICAVITMLLPGSVVFGRMIGHESLVLFFVLCVTYTSLLYRESQKQRYLFLAVLSVILGTLSDWPMTYFTVSLLPFFHVQKQIKTGLLLVSVSAVTALLFLFYVYMILGSLDDLFSAFLVRGPGLLLSYEYWPIKWLMTIGLRMVLYFNPVIILISIFFFFMNKNMDKSFVVLILGFFLFGLIHVLLYLEGSFGHAYWIYYFIPFLTYSAGVIVYRMYNKKKYLLLGAGCIFCILFLIRIEDWKSKEYLSNLWRHDLIHEANEYLQPQFLIGINPDSAVESELISYQFSRPVIVISAEDVVSRKEQFDTYVYSCMYRCNEELELTFIDRFESKHFIAPEGELFIFSLNKPIRENGERKTDQAIEVQTLNLPYKETVIKQWYIQIKDILRLPQV